MEKRLCNRCIEIQFAIDAILLIDDIIKPFGSTDDTKNRWL